MLRVLPSTRHSSVNNTEWRLPAGRTCLSGTSSTIESRILYTSCLTLPSLPGTEHVEVVTGGVGVVGRQGKPRTVEN